MKITGKRDSLSSYMGTFCSFALITVVLMYTYLKADTLIQRKDVDVLSTVVDMHFDPDFVFDYS